MDSIETLQAFFGWTIVVHVAVLSLMLAAITVAGQTARSIHGRMFGLSEEEISKAYFRFFATYKVGVWIFAIAPWAGLQLLS